MKLRHLFLLLALLLPLLAAPVPSGAGLRDMLKGDGGGLNEGNLRRGKMSCKDKVKQLERAGPLLKKRLGDGPKPSLTFTYGDHKLQAIDVFLPEKSSAPAPYPIIVMVHGGGWCIGDKSNSGVVAGKVSRWLPRGFIVVSVNYRMISDGVYPVEQAADAGRALGYVQREAEKWQGDASRIFLMGHSAGAHIVSLLGSNPAHYGLTPWLGTVSLDSAAMNIPKKMKSNPANLYQEAFGTDADYWVQSSPFDQLSQNAVPWLGVCSSRRRDSCSGAHEYADKQNDLGIPAAVLEEPKNHGSINSELGKDAKYTATVEKFMAGLDDEVKKRLAR